MINKHGLKVASPGSVAFNFERKGVIRVPSEQVKDFDDFFLDTAEVGRLPHHRDCHFVFRGNSRMTDP